LPPDPPRRRSNYPFVFAELKGGTDGFALKAADATQGKLQTMWDGPRPSAKYQPMVKRGGLILGVRPRARARKAPQRA
jgi:hypothetical protein